MYIYASAAAVWSRAFALPEVQMKDQRHNAIRDLIGHTAVASQDLFSPDRSLTGAVMLDDIDLDRRRHEVDEGRTSFLAIRPHY